MAFDAPLSTTKTSHQARPDALGRKFRAILTAAPVWNIVEDRRNGKAGWDWSDTQASIALASRLRSASKKRIPKKAQSEAVRLKLKERYEAGEFDVYDRIDTKIEQISFDNKLVRERLEEGFCWSGGRFGGAPSTPGGSLGYSKAAFTFKGLVSDQDPILQLFSSKLFKAGYSTRRPRIKTGNHKNEVLPNTRKVLALDDAEVCFNTEMRGIIRIDIDRNFAGVEDLLRAIAIRGVPAPNLIVGATKDNTLVRPHLYWLLLDSVCWKGKARERPKRMFQTIEAALTCKLISLGADVGGLLNSVRGKNPLSPLWTTYVAADAPYRLNRFSSAKAPDPYGLPVLTEGLGIGQVKAGDQVIDDAWALRRRLFKTADNLFESIEEDTTGRLESNRLFGVICRRVSDSVRKFHHLSPESKAHQPSGDINVALLATQRACEREIEASVPGWAERSNMPIAEVHDMAMSCLDYMWKTFDPDKIKKDNRPLRGRLKDDCLGRPTSERQAMGGRDVAARRRTNSLNTLATSLNRIMSEQDATIPSLTKLAKESGISRSTAYAIGFVVIKATAEKLKTAISVIKKTQRNSRINMTLPFLAATSPTRCLVKRESTSCLSAGTDSYVLTGSLQENILMEDIFLSSDNNLSGVLNPKNIDQSLKARLFSERLAQADKRIHKLLASKGQGTVQTSMFDEFTHDHVIGAPLYHYLSAKQAGMIKMKVNSVSW
jgi:hypothetical protein